MNKLTGQERKQDMESLIFLMDNCDGIIKVQACANGSIQKYWTNKEEISSQTVALESVILTTGIDVHEEREVAIVDITNEFIQTENPKKW